MCGFSGYLGNSVDYNNFIRSANTIKFRGPDTSQNFNIKINNNFFYLNHHRLEILDIQNGSQPMQSSCGSYTIVFNGEIYNFLELKEKLIERGFFFKTSHSDTEVILNSYSLWGEDCLKYLKGMWSFLIYDKKKNLFFFSRDRFGEKPFFYSKQNNDFFFSSQMSFFSNMSNFNLQLNITNVQKYCAYGYFPNACTPFKSIYKLPSGSYGIYKIDEKKIEIYKFWQYEHDPNYGKTEKYWQDSFKETLINSVKSQLISDVSIGTFLSGGIDSSVITQIVSKNVNTKLNTFSINFDENSFSEEMYSDYVSDKLNTNHFKKKIKVSDLSDIFVEYSKKFDEPLSDSSVLSYYVLCKLAFKHNKVVLGGDGADELLAGYDTFTILKFVKFLKFLKIKNFKSLVEKIINNFSSNHSHMNLKFKLSRLLRHNFENENLSNQRWLSPFTIEELSELFDANIKEDEIYEDTINLWDFGKSKDSISRTINFYSNSFLTDQILVKTDRCSMMHGLEVRSPFLHIDLVNLLQQMPSEFKLKNLTNKFILKKSFEIEFNKKFLYRKKIGFSSPLSKWFSEKNFHYKFISNVLKNNSKFLENLISQHKILKKENRIPIWNLMNLDMFLYKNNF